MFEFTVATCELQEVNQDGLAIIELGEDHRSYVSDNLRLDEVFEIEPTEMSELTMEQGDDGQTNIDSAKQSNVK